MTQQENEQIKPGGQSDEDVRQAISAHLRLIPQTRLAREAGLSGPAVSQWVNEKYKGDNAAVKEKMMAWLATHAESAAVTVTGAHGGSGWVNTPTAKAIERAFVLARSLPSIAVVFGVPGVGKTMAIRHYARTSPNVWVITASPAIGSMAAVLKQIGLALDVRGGYRNYDLSFDITRRLKGTRGLLVVDEAQHLTKAALEQVRAIHDAAEIGVALCGNETVYSQLTGGNRRIDHAQLFSRCSPIVRLHTPKDGDVNAILDAWRITGNAVKDFAMQIALLPGGLRGLVKTLEQAALFSPDEGAPDLLMMKTAWAELGGAS